MKIVLLETRLKNSTMIYKDFAGGLGPGFSVGRSIFSKAIEFSKRKGVNLCIPTLGYLNAIFKKNGHLVEYKINEVNDADLVIIPSSLVEHNFEIETARKIKSKGRARVGFIGPFSATFPDKFLEASDFIIKGEPEFIANRISEDWIPEGVVESKDISNLDELPFPDWDIFPVDKSSYFPSLNVKPVLPILSSRGCPYKCNYCPYLIQYKNWRIRSAENVLSEIEYLVTNYKIKGLVFRDPIFSFPMERAEKIAEGLIRKKIKIKFACETRLDCLTVPLLDIMYDGGLRTINVGIESLNKELLTKSSRKVIDYSHQEEIITYCDKKGINVTAFYILGWPDETLESAMETIRYAKKLNTNVASFTIYTPFPGTVVFEQLKDKFITEDLTKFDAHNLVFKHKNFSPEALFNIKEKAYISYYFRPKYLIKFVQRLLRK